MRDPPFPGSRTHPMTTCIQARCTAATAHPTTTTTTTTLKAIKGFKTPEGAARAGDRLVDGYWTRYGVTQKGRGFFALLWAGTPARPTDVRLVGPRAYADGFGAVEAVLGRGDF